MSIQRIPSTAPKLRTRFWEAPRNINSSIRRVKTHISRWKQVTEETAYLVGKEFIWQKNTRDHGEFLDAVARTGIHIRTAQRLMSHAKECDGVNRLLPYHPRKSKGDTVSLLEPPSDKENLQHEKPEHQPGASKEWNVTDAAQALLARYERLVSGRSDQERLDVLTAFSELAADANTERSDMRRMVREGGGRMIDEED